MGVLRKATQLDVDDIYVFRKTIANEQPWVPAKTKVSISTNIATRTVFVVVEDDLVIGELVLFENSPSSTLIESLGVLHAHRGKGLGAALINAAVEYTAERDLYVRVSPKNLEARAFYAKLKFINFSYQLMLRKP